jgi:hypothetical protein
MGTPVKTKTLAEKIELNIYEGYNKGMINDTEMVQIIILLFDLLGLCTISEYAKRVGKTYRGVSKYCKKIININNNKFVIDNE